MASIFQKIQSSCLVKYSCLFKNMSTNETELLHHKISLCPICVGNGDAIFVTIDKNGKIQTIYTITELLRSFILKTDGGKECYLVDGSISGYNMGILKRNGALVNPSLKSAKTDSSKLRATYLTLANNGYTLKGIVVTHPDRDHYKGIQKLVDHDIDCPAILLTDQFLGKAIINEENEENEVEKFLQTLEHKKYSGKHAELDEIYEKFPREIFSLQFPNSSPVLYQPTAEMMPRPRNKKMHEDNNETSILVTISDPERKKPLALLTGDANFTKVTENVRKDVPLVLVPHHGSKNNSNKAFYESLTAQVCIYLISCGTHRKFAFPDGKVIKDICDATRSKGTSCTIILTRGRHLNSLKMPYSSPDEWRKLREKIEIHYWDEYIYEELESLLDTPWLNLSLCPQPDFADGTIKWSLEEYENITSKCLEELNDRVYESEITLEYTDIESNETYYLSVKNADLDTATRKASVKVISGLPSPLDPCNWDSTEKILKIKGVESTFLQIHSPTENFTVRSPFESILFKCCEVPWLIKYARFESGNLKWSDNAHNQPRPYDKAIATLIKKN